GQSLKIPNGTADNIKTASIPSEKVDPKPTQPAAAQQTASVQPSPYKAPAATQTVDIAASRLGNLCQGITLLDDIGAGRR
ncbi:hypothetical protein ACCS53_39095, partial [Rhizobium ruizarguesonis]